MFATNNNRNNSDSNSTSSIENDNNEACPNRRKYVFRETDSRLGRALSEETNKTSTQRRHTISGLTVDSENSFTQNTKGNFLEGISLPRRNR